MTLIARDQFAPTAQRCRIEADGRRHDHALPMPLPAQPIARVACCRASA